MTTQKYFLILIYIVLLLLFNFCNAPHNNPLDPENSENQIGLIDGYIKTVKIPRAAIKDAKIYWPNNGIITNTNSSGYFVINNIERNDGWLIIEKTGYTIDSVYVNFNNQKKISQNIFLNAIPVIEELKFFSITQNKYPSKQVYSLGVRVKIDDEENDIDSVFIQNEELNVNKELLYNASQRYYENSITLEDLTITSIDIVIGKEFKINVFDTDSKKFEIGSANIKRIIKEEIITTSPSGRDTVFTNNPLLVWNRFTPGFEFKYLLEIFTDEIDPTLIWQNEVNSTNIQFQTNTNLSSGDYFWVIWAIDEFNNRTRSKPASFIIK